MKNNKRKLLLTYLLLSSISLSACKSKNTEIKTDINTANEITTCTEINITENSTTEYTEEITENTSTNTTEYISDDEKIINIINEDKELIEYYVSTDDIENVKKYGKEFFIRTVDFIFYDTEINGIKFNDLKEETKEEIYNTFCNIDSLIMMVAPDYKEDIDEKYEIVKDFTVNIYYSSLDKIKEVIGEEDYNKIKNIKDDVKEKISNGIDDAKQYIKEKYEDFRD